MSQEGASPPTQTDMENSDDERTLTLIRLMLEMGVVPKVVRVGSVEVQVHSVVKAAEERAPSPGSYVEKAMRDQRARKLGGDR